MNATIILIGLLAAPVVALMVLRINAALVFLSLCLGSVLVQFVGPDAATIVSSTSAHPTGMPSNQMTVNLLLLLLPVALTAVFMVHSVKGHAKLLYNLLPSIGVSSLLSLLAVPLLSVQMTNALVSIPLWIKLQNLQTLIISTTTLLALFALWMQRPKGGRDEHGKH